MFRLLWIIWTLTHILKLFASTVPTAISPRYCQAKPPSTLECYKQLPSTPNPDIRALELHHITEWELVDFAQLSALFPNLRNVTMRSGKMKRLRAPTRKVANIQVLDLAHMRIESVSSHFLSHFPNLETLNLRSNSLRGFSGNFTVGHVQNVYLSDNKWNCSMDLDWIFEFRAVGDLANVTCWGEPHNGKSVRIIAQFVREIKSECPAICSCKLNKIYRSLNNGDYFEPMIEVMCANASLKQLPVKIPRQTKILHVQNNAIEDLGPLKTNKLYKSLLEIYLDNNQIKTIEDLEGSYWLRHFRVFSLAGNKLTELPTYALDNALTQNGNMPEAVRINLGGNPWRCDCVFTPVFQEMLQKFAQQIRDIRDVKCSYVEGDENSLLPIIELSRSSVCRLPTEYSVKALNLLNGILASLIVFILGKLAYDYYYFKKTGRLPWIVTKMP